MSNNITHKHDTAADPIGMIGRAMADAAAAASSAEVTHGPEPVFWGGGALRLSTEMANSAILTIDAAESEALLEEYIGTSGLQVGIIIDAAGRWCIHTHPEFATLNPRRAGLLAAPEPDWVALDGIEELEIQTLEEWREDLSDPDAAYFLRQRCFLDDVGLALMQLREACDVTRGQIAARAGMNRATVIAIEGAFKEEGNKLSTVAKFLLPLRSALPLTLTPLHSPRGLTVPMPFASDPAGFAAAMVTRLRRLAGFSQAELGFRMSMPRAMLQGKPVPMPANLPKSSPTVSRIENGQQKDGARMGTLFNIAYACGFLLGVDLDKSREA